MTCATCGHQNRDAARFCEECGGTLARACPRCGTEGRPGARFCDGCGAPLAAGPSGAPSPPAPRRYTPAHLAERILGTRQALEGERKRVTVLFADIQGSMGLAEQVDPEDWHGIIDRFFTIMAEGVHRFDGTVNQYTGDGIMALFGAPLAHEDHAQRACFAALHLQEALRRYANELRIERGLALGVRIGLNSGEVVVGRIGDDLRMEYTAQGHTVGLAARMQQLAEPGRTYLTGTTAGLVEGYFALEGLGAASVKGVSEPVEVFALAGVGAIRTRLDLSRSRGFSKFVGRMREMAILEDALAETVEGRGQMVSVVAEAGTGKSRLCFEFLERCHERGFTVYKTQCLAHGRAMPLAPVLELYRGVFGIEEGEPARAARDKIAGRTLLLDPSLVDGLPLLFDFLGAPDPARPLPPMDPEVRHRTLVGILQRFTRARAPREPVIVLLEDLHWIDPGSEVFMPTLADGVPAGRVLLLVTTRPEHPAPWLQRSYHRQVPLAPLGPEAVDELLDDLLGRDASLVGLPERVRERGGGNPFFVEEMVRELVERGHLAGEPGARRLVAAVDQVPLPATVQGVLAGRIDRLGDEAKAALQAASAIGRSFALGLLGEIAGQPPAALEATLAGLVGDEFLYQETLYPEPEYVFKHALTCEVAYESMLGERRRALHAALARALETRVAETGDERAALVAHHWDHAGEAMPAARWHRRAALWIGLSNARECYEHWQRVRELVGQVAETPETLALGVQACCQALTRGLRAEVEALDAPGLLAEARRRAARSGDPLAEIQVLGTEGGAAWIQGELARAAPLLDRALAMARRTGDQRVVSSAVPFWVIVHSFRAPRRVVETLGAIGELDEDATGEVLGWHGDAFLRCVLANCLMLTGSIEEASRTGAAAVERARRADARLELALSMANWAQGLAIAGDRTQALALARESVRTAEATGVSVAIATAYATLIIVLGEHGDETQMAELGAALARLAETAYGPLIPILSLGEAVLARWRGEPALAALRTAHAAVEATGNFTYTAILLLHLASALVAERGTAAADEVERTLERARGDLEALEARLLLPRVELVRADLLAVLGDEAGRRRALEAARAAWAAMRAEHLVANVEGLLAA